MWHALLRQIQTGNIKALARSISLIENEVDGYREMLHQLPESPVPLIGVTGAPGAGKSTLTDALIGAYIAEGKRVAVVCVDPSSPFNLGALLGDRIRMSQWYNHPNVFIRSLASRGSLGGLHPKIIEITDLLRAARFDIVIVETVGVGQSEIEIAGLADVTVVVMVPEGGDEIQTMKAGLMEIADIFALNKADRPGADLFARNLRSMLVPVNARRHREVPVISTVATLQQGLAALKEAIKECLLANPENDRKYWLLTAKVWHLLQQERMKDINKAHIYSLLKAEKTTNVYRFVQKHFLVPLKK